MEPEQEEPTPQYELIGELKGTWYLVSDDRRYRINLETGEPSLCPQSTYEPADV